tara:strand:- start:824 stop:2737 length:1914 start_codon:yes stop_codon:yes gene_type:complete
MARKEDISLENQLIEKRKEYNRRVEEGLPYQKKLLEEIEGIEEEISKINEARVKSINEQTKARKGYVKLSQDAKKAEESINKSFSSRLVALVKGNVAGAIGLKTTRDHEEAVSSLANEAKDMAKDALDNGKLDGKQKAGVVSLTSDIKDGLMDEEGIRAKIAELGLEDKDVGKEILNNALGLNKTQGEVVDKGKLAAKNMARFAKLGAGALVIFTGLKEIAEKFAGSVDAIGAGFGSLNVTSDEVKHNLMDAEIASAGIGATIQDVVAVTNAVAGDFGVGAAEASKMSAQLLDTAKAVGLSSEEAAKLSGILQTTSGLSSEQAERLTEGAYQLAQANNVAPKAVMEDLASSAEEFALFSKDGGDNLAKAAVQARAMGLSLADTTKIASGLLDFEQSIAAEVEASVLIGRQLNLQKARELALNNNIEGAMRAVVDQLGSEAEFNELNSIQRDALAKSIGVEASQLAKMVANQEKSAVAAGQTAKSFSDIAGKEAMSNLTAAMNEITKFGVVIAQIVGPILELVLKAVNPILGLLGAGAESLASMFRMDFGGSTMNDGVVGRGGISMMAGPAGVFSLNPRDSVMATTNPIPVNDVRSGPAGSMGGKQTIVMNARVRGRDLVFLNDRPNAGGDAGYEGLA